MEPVQIKKRQRTFNQVWSLSRSRSDSGLPIRYGAYHDQKATEDLQSGVAGVTFVYSKSATNLARFTVDAWNILCSLIPGSWVVMADCIRWPAQASNIEIGVSCLVEALEILPCIDCSLSGNILWMIWFQGFAILMLHFGNYFFFQNWIKPFLSSNYLKSNITQI